jgi:uncharacterized metal-binding protein YceD (DUF177 family)
MSADANEKLPITLVTNLGRLGQAGDSIGFAADAEQRAALAKFADILSVEKFAAHIELKKISPTHYGVSYRLTAEISQACVVTLEPLVARIGKDFSRELQFAPQLRRGPSKDEKAKEGKELVVGALEDDEPEVIESLQYDLAGPLVEEFVLAIDPYPRAPGVEFAAPADAQDKPQNPFAALKDLKRGD